MNDIAVRLFGNELRTQVLRAFTVHKERSLTLEELLTLTKGKRKALVAEIAMLKRQKVIGEAKGKAEKGLIVVDMHIRELLPKLFSHATTSAEENLISKVKKAGPLKLMICSGVLTGEQNSPLDMLLVGSFHEKHLAKALKPLEAMHGAELRCAVFTEEEYHHRLDVRDLMIAHVLEGKHKVLLDKTKRPQR
jgi:hypothetical protein